MKKIILLILLLFIILPSLVLAQNNTQNGAEIYLEAMEAVNKKEFATAKEKFEKAASYLSGENQAAALKMADFFGKMSSEITQNKLSLEDNWIALGEVNESDRFWQLYQFQDYGASILRLAMSGEKPIEEMAEAIGSDLFSKELVIKNREGYLSKPNISTPGIVSRIRMWYCDKDNTTNIIYETDGYAKDGNAPTDKIIQNILTELNWSFSNVKCSKSFPKWIFAVSSAILLAVIIFLWRKYKSN